MYTSLHLLETKYSESLQLGFHTSLWLIYAHTGSPVSISEIAIVGVGDNHVRKKGQERLYHTAKVAQHAPKGRRAATFLSQLTAFPIPSHHCHQSRRAGLAVNFSTTGQVFIRCSIPNVVRLPIWTLRRQTLCPRAGEASRRTC